MQMRLEFLYITRMQSICANTFARARWAEPGTLAHWHGRSRSCAHPERRGPSMEDCMAVRAVGISVQGVVNNLGIDYSNVSSKRDAEDVRMHSTISTIARLPTFPVQTELALTLLVRVRCVRPNKRIATIGFMMCVIDAILV